MTPRETISAATAAWMRGEVETVVRAFALPTAIEKDGIHHVVETESDMTEAVSTMLADLLARGVRSARGKVVQDREEEDNAFFSVTVDHLDAAGDKIDESRVSYLMRRDMAGDWRIIVMTVDRACSYTPGACVLDDGVA